MTASLDQLIGRCLMVGVRGARPDDPILEADLRACRDARIRAVILFDVHLPTRGARNIESPAQLDDLILHIKATLGGADGEVIVGVDQEGGRVARLKPDRGFRPSLTAAELGALSEDDRVAEASAEAAQLAALGFNLNFAPCVDLGDHPHNPIITRLSRAYSGDAGRVAACARDVISAHLDHNVVPCLKHFPGHGSTASDSHLDLPDITRTWNPFTDINPYRVLIATMPEARFTVMTGHLLHTFIDPRFPATLSRAITTDLLRTEFGFRHPVITDSLDMGAITRRWPAHEAAALALRAGADIALHAFNSPADAPDAPHPALALAASVRAALESGELSESDLRASADRINDCFFPAGD